MKRGRSTKDVLSHTHVRMNLNKQQCDLITENHLGLTASFFFVVNSHLYFRIFAEFNREKTRLRCSLLLQVLVHQFISFWLFRKMEACPGKPCMNSETRNHFSSIARFRNFFSSISYPWRSRNIGSAADTKFKPKRTWPSFVHTLIPCVYTYTLKNIPCVIEIRSSSADTKVKKSQNEICDEFLGTEVERRMTSFNTEASKIQ